MNILVVVLINALFLIVPLVGGFLAARMINRYRTEPIAARRAIQLRYAGLAATFAGYALALMLAKLQVLGYPASLLCGAILFVPGVFALALGVAAYRPEADQECVQ